MKQISHFVTGLTAFVNNIGTAGKIGAIALPKLETLRETITQGGFERSVSTGVFKAMEMEIPFPAANTHVLESWGAHVKITLKGSVKSGSTNYPIQVTVKGDRDIDWGTLEEGKALECKVKVYVDYYELLVDGEQHALIDLDNTIGIIYGTDYLEDLRTHLSA